MQIYILKLLSLSNLDIFFFLSCFMYVILEDFLSLKRAVEGKTFQPVGVTLETQI